MKRAWTIAIAVAALVALCLATSGAAVAAAAPASPRVTIVIATGLTWADITPTATPTLWHLAETGAIGNVNARMRNRENGEPPTALEGALDISAGNWATPNFLAPPAYNVTESVGGLSAAEVFRRTTGHAVGGSIICFPGMPMTLAANADPESDVVIGTLGQAIHDAGGVTGAIGNSDAGEQIGGGPRLQRPAAVASIDERGLVDAGDVSPDLLQQASAAPYGVKTDVSAFARALAAFDASATAHGGPALLTLDPGDAYRARRNAGQVAPNVAAAQHAAAVTELDRVVALAQAHTRSGDTLMVAAQSPASDPVSNIQGFGPLLVSGMGLHGYLDSPSTHRAGILTNLDITAGALQAAGVTRPVQVVGSSLTSAEGPAAAEERIAHLVALNTTAVSIDGVRSQVADTYIKLFAAALAFAALFIALRDRVVPRAQRVCAIALGVVALALLAVEPAGWLMFVVSPNVGSPIAAIAMLLAASLVLLAAGLAVWRFAGLRTAAAALSLFAVVLLVADQFFGAPLSFINFTGYSPLQSARYYGMGNQPAAYIVGASIVGVALLLDRWHEARWAGALRRIGLPLLGALVVVSAAAPFLGANVGVAVWGSAGFVVAWALMNGRRITWKMVLVALIVIVLLIAAFAAIDVFGHGPKTHLARSVTSAQQGGVGQLWQLVARKASTNARVLGETEWAWALYALIAFAAIMLLRRPSELASALEDNPALRAAIWACSVACVLSYLTEDSGIIVPAFLILPLGSALIAVVLRPILAEKPTQ
ncbi:MAG: hypothetical protein P4L93_02040 [Coriobacteriia bacterium]|nr:hypothetical protein [Coriobacteriia bacterium]